MGKRLMLGMIAVAALTLSGCLMQTLAFWSPDGKSIAYLADGKLRLYDVATKDTKPLDTGQGSVLSVAWSPDGKRLAFYSATQGKQGRISLREIALASGRVTTLLDDVAPSFLPQEGPPTDEGESPDQALEQAQSEAMGLFSLVAGLAWSPDGKRLAYLHATPETGRVFILDYPSLAVKAVMPEDRACIGPAWSPDGRWLACVQVPSAPQEPPPPAEAGEAEPAVEPESLWLYDVAAGALSKVCDLPGEGSAMGARLQWSADSRQIGFIALAEASMGPTGITQGGMGCLVEARPHATVRNAVTGITSMAAWSPGLEGVAYVTEAEPAVFYKAVGADHAKALGKLPVPVEPKPREGGPPEGVGVSFSLPEFSLDGSRVALTVGDGADVQVVVLAVK